MTTKRQTDKRRWGRALPALLAGLLAGALVWAAPPLDGLAHALPADTPGTTQQDPSTPGAGAGSQGKVDLSQSCTLTLNFPPDGAMGEHVMQLKPEDTLADLYQVAAAVPIPGYDAYAFCVDDTSPYYQLIKDFVQEESRQASWRSQVLSSRPAGLTGGAGAGEWLMFHYAPDNPESAPVSDWAGLVELLAKACFDPGEKPYQAGPTQTTTIGTPAADLPAGLYLTIVHGRDIPPAPDSDLPPYILQEKDESGDGFVLRSIAYTDTYLYTFQPQLIALPSMDGRSGNGNVTTTSGAWQYNVTAVTKPAYGSHFASLQIIKNLQKYDKPVTFVFQVTATDPAGKGQPYQKIVSITFDKAGVSEPVLIADAIPAGWDVTITELYDGGYSFTGVEASVTPNLAGAEVPALNTTVDTGSRSITIHAIPSGSISLTPPGADAPVTVPGGSTVTATFTNTAPEVPPPGDTGSVVNHFDPDEDAGGWYWTKRYYDAEKGVWVEEAPTPVKPH